MVAAHISLLCDVEVVHRMHVKVRPRSTATALIASHVTERCSYRHAHASRETKWRHVKVFHVGSTEKCILVDKNKMKGNLILSVFDVKTKPTQKASTKNYICPKILLKFPFNIKFKLKTFGVRIISKTFTKYRPDTLLHTVYKRSIFSVMI